MSKGAYLHEWTHGRASLATPRHSNHWILLLEGLTRTENVHAWMGQMVQYDWSEHLTDHNLRALIELKKHILIRGLKLIQRSTEGRGLPAWHLATPSPHLSYK